MLVFLNKALSDGNNPSSARLINVGGWVVATILLVIDYYHSMRIDYNSFSSYLLYCGGSYVGGKAVGGIQNYMTTRGNYGDNQQPIQRSGNVRNLND